MCTILWHELNRLLHGIVAYVVLGVFAAGTWLVVWIIPHTNVMDYGYADLGIFFATVPHLFMWLMPAVTMRSFAEEFKTGTFVLWLMAPVQAWEVVIGKYLACVTLMSGCLLLSLPYGITLYYATEPAGNMDVAGTVGAYVGVLLLGSLFAAIGMLGSVLSKNQVVSFVCSVALCAMLYYGFPALAVAEAWSHRPLLLEQLGIAYHYESLNKGLLQSNELTYFIVTIALVISFTIIAVERRR